MVAQLGKTPDFARYIQLLLELHRAMARFGADSPKADQIRDQMDEPWSHLTEDEIRQVNGLSQDLYTIGQSEAPGALSRPAQPEELAKHAADLLLSHKWEQLLELLRSGSLSRPPDIVASTRAHAWEGLGFPEVALEFYDEAIRAAPDSRRWASHARSKLQILSGLRRTDELERLARQILATKDSDPHDRTVANTILFEVLWHRHKGNLRAQDLSALASEYEADIPQLPLEQSSERQVYLHACVLLAWFYVELREFGAFDRLRQNMGKTLTQEELQEFEVEVNALRTMRQSLAKPYSVNSETRSELESHLSVLTSRVSEDEASYSKRFLEPCPR